jgi:hypothetical protein
MSSHPPTRKTRIILISDTHNQTPKLPSGDVLIHAGDLTNQGSYSELKKTVDWLEKADFAAKIVVGGTLCLQLLSRKTRHSGVSYGVAINPIPSPSLSPFPPNPKGKGELVLTLAQEITISL